MYKKNIKNIIAGLFILPTLSFSNVSIENIGINEGAIDYTDNIFNHKINMPQGCYTVKEVFDYLYDQTGYTISNQTNIDVTKPNCSAYKFDKVGNLLDAMLTDMKTLYRVVHDTIVLEYVKEYSAKFPMNWDVEATIIKLKEKYPHIKMYTFGQSIRIEGSQEDINNASKTLERVRDWAHREIPMNILVSQLELGLDDTEDKDRPQALKDKYNQLIVMSKIPKDGKVNRIKVSHGMAYPLHLEIGTAVFDLQKNRIIINNSKYINLSQINSYSFMKNGYQVSFSSPFGSHLY